MKNVKVILISVALCATVFANARIDALGGDAGFWPGDRANAAMFPGTLNDANWVEFGGVNGATTDTDEDSDTYGENNGSMTGSINWGDDVKWGFNFDTSADNHDWMDISWAKDGMGVRVGFVSSSAEWTDEADMSGFDLAWGSTMSFGEIGVGYSTHTEGDADAVTNLWVNWRGDCNLWLFDNAKASLAMGDDTMDLTYDLFTHVTPADGVTALVGMGFGYHTNDLQESTEMWLPNAVFAVEAAMTDWATVRAFTRQHHILSCDMDGDDCGTGNASDYGFGLGFGWQAANGGSVNLDMEVGNNIFTEPVHTMTGFGAIGSGQVTLSYLF